MERLGGTNIDEALLNYIDHATDNALADLDITNRSTAAMLARLHRDCALAKEALSFDDDAVVPVFLPDRQVDVRLTRSTLEGLARPMLETTAGVFRQALDAADVTAHDLGAVLLTGGSTRVPLLGRMISDLAGRPVVTDRHPEFVTALGAARLAVTGARLRDAVRLPGRGLRQRVTGRPRRAGPAGHRSTAWRCGRSGGNPRARRLPRSRRSTTRRR